MPTSSCHLVILSSCHLHVPFVCLRGSIQEAAAMEVQRFEAIQTEFLARVSQAVYCTMATVDRQNRPRSRVLHPIWEGPIGWVISWPASHKAKHLAHNPAVSLAYIPDKDKPVYVDAVAEWADTVEEKQ